MTRKTITGRGRVDRSETEVERVKVAAAVNIPDIEFLNFLLKLAITKIISN